MSPLLLIIIILIVVVFISIILIAISISIIRKRRIKTMHTKITNFFNNYVKENEGSSFTKSDISECDYILTTKRNKYFIKVIPNLDNQEITINNATRWQLRRGFSDKSLRYVPDVEPLMRRDNFELDGKRLNKMYLIYPNARTLLRYINECEMEFVLHDTDVYGSKVITYINLERNRDSIIK